LRHRKRLGNERISVRTEERAAEEFVERLAIRADTLSRLREEGRGGEGQKFLLNAFNTSTG